MEHKTKFIKLCNSAIICLCLIIAVLFYGDMNEYILQRDIIKKTTYLRIQSSEDQLAYSKLLKKDPSNLQYLPPPTILSITAPSKQFLIGEGISPIFNGKEKLTIEGLAAPKSLVNIIFMPIDISLSAIASDEGIFSLPIEPDILNKGEYQIYTEGILNNSSTGKIRRIDILITEPVSKNTILIYGSIGLLLIAVIVFRIYLGGSVRVER